MIKTLHIAWREFAATVLTKSFLIGVLIAPLLLTGMIPLAIVLVSNKPPIVKGSIAVIDRSGGERGLASEQIIQRLSAESLAAESVREVKEATEMIAEHLGPEGAQAAKTAAAMSPTPGLEGVPQLTVEVLPADTDPEVIKKSLLEGTVRDGSRLALIVVDPDAVISKGGQFATFQLFIKAKLDSRVHGRLSSQVARAIIYSRLANSGQDPVRVLTMTRLASPQAVAVTDVGEKESGEMQQMMVPLAFMMLLWISVFTGGQYLMTSTIEEKSSRVMEVLLSAVSPLQLMTGKILGQMSAGLLILFVYSGLGISSLFYFQRNDLLDWSSLLFLVIFFFIAFFTMASMMAAIGSAVTDIHEAQTLLMPVMLVVMVPMLLMMPIIYNPKGTMATVLSFIPPVSPFVMVLRISSSDPPPLWQTLLAIAVGIATVIVFTRLAAKIFRIGVLMYGKPPNFATLVRWIRMA